MIILPEWILIQAGNKLSRARINMKAKAFELRVSEMEFSSFKSEYLLFRRGLYESGRQDLNLRPLRPERSALAKLSYSPVKPDCEYSTFIVAMQIIINLLDRYLLRP